MHTSSSFPSAVPPADAHAPHGLARLGAWIERLGRTQVIVWITLVSMLVSVASGLLTLSQWGEVTSSEWQLLIGLCIAVPMLVAPPIAWVVATLSLEAEAAQRLAEHLAVTDSLTELANRRNFFELAEREFTRARRAHEPLAMLLLDIDHFKSVDDGHGHAMGDEVLIRVARACRARVREHDTLARFGGEEFVLLLPATPLDGAMALAEDLRLAVAALAIETPAGPSIRPTLSIGVASLASHDTAVTGLLDRADRAMYAAKKAGRNRVSPDVAVAVPAARAG